MNDRVLDLVADLNPAPSRAVDTATTADLRRTVLWRVSTPPPRRRLRVGAAAALAAAVVAVPAFATSAALRSLFEFSPPSEPVPATEFESRALDALSYVRARPDTVGAVATHGETALYAARSEAGGVCVGAGPRGAATPTFTQLQCGDGSAGAFPSPSVPVVQFGNIFGQEGSDELYLSTLIGFAADGVAVVGVRGPAGTVARAEVSRNVFAADVPPQPVTDIEAYDHAGQLIWSRPLVGEAR